MTQTTEQLPITVSQLTQQIKQRLEQDFPALYLQGEVSNFRRQASGHLYFSLKDAESQISAVMFRGAAQHLKTLPKDGDQVTVRGDLNVYPPRGNYQLVVRELQLAGMGELLARLEMLKQALHKKGYFAKKHKKSLPRFPRTVGVVTSPTGAAIRDILNVLGRRHAGVRVLINPVRVQGAEAAGEIAQAIDQFNQLNLADVLIVGRGGGSIEDLWPFNEEIVADAIFRSQIPIIGAVGHETDHCIAEYVADMRAPTPSAAAEMVICERQTLIDGLQNSRRRLEQTLRHLCTQERRRLDGFLRHPLFSSPYALLGPHLQRFDDLRDDLNNAWRQKLQQNRLRLEGCSRQLRALSPAAQIRASRQRLGQLQRALDNSWQQRAQRRKERLQAVKQGLEAVDPKNLLQRGYSIVFAEKDHSVITSVAAVAPQQRIRILVADGEVTATVEGAQERS